MPVRHGIEGRLKIQSVQALDAAGVTEIDVAMTGRDARLVGTVADDAERQRIHDLVRSRVGVRHVDESGLTGAVAVETFSAWRTRSPSPTERRLTNKGVLRGA